MIGVEEMMNCYKESFTDMEEMMRRLLQSQKEKQVEATPDSSHQVESGFMGTASMFTGKGLKVDVPRFNEEEIEDWVFKITEFFDIYGVPNEQRIKISSFHMEGSAYTWYKWVMKNTLVQTWSEFINALMLRFGTSLYDDPKAALKDLKQISTVTEYQTQFELISTKVTGLSEQWLIIFFIVGLQDTLKCELLLAQPTSYYQAVSLAKLHEQKLTTLQNTMKYTSNKMYSSSSTTSARTRSIASAYIQPNFRSPTQSVYTTKSNQQLATTLVNNASVQSSPSVTSSSSTTQIKKLTAAELKLRREKGLCYYCDEKYNPGHKWKTACFLLVGDEEVDELIQDYESEEVSDVVEQGTQINSMEVALEISIMHWLVNFIPVPCG